MSAHFAPIPPETPRDRKRLDSKISLVDGGYSSPCHSVAGFRRHKQYPGFQIGPRAYRAHRVTYAWAAGDTPYDIHHKCNNAWCVNPEHLEPAVDGQKRHRNTNADLCSKGHPFNKVNNRGDRICTICRLATQRRSVAKNKDKINARRRETRERVTYDPRPCEACTREYQPLRSTSRFCARKDCVNQRQRLNRAKRMEGK